MQFTGDCDELLNSLIPVVIQHQIMKTLLAWSVGKVLFQVIAWQNDVAGDNFGKTL